MAQADQISRRRFLARTATTSAAGMAASYALSPVAAGAPAKTPPDRVRVGVIGVGGQGRWHVKELIKAPEADVIALCDVWQERLDFALGLCEGKARGYKDYRELLADERVDAVLIATPPHWHAMMAIDACEAGKDVYIEKPMTLNLAESKAVRNAVRRHGRISQVGTQIHATPNYRRVVDVIRSGVLGPINVARTFHVLNQTAEGIGFPANDEIPEGFEWEMWKGPGPEIPFNELLIKGSYEHGSFWYSGGWTPGMAPHLLDLPIWALDLRLPTSVSSSGGRYVIKDCGDAYDTHEVMIQYPNVTLTWMTSLVNSFAFDFQLDPGMKRRRGIYMHGVNGTLLADYPWHKVIPEGDRMTEEDAAKVPKVTPDSPGHHREWLQGILTRRPPSCNVDYHYKIDVAINLAMLSLKLGRSIRFDPKTEQIVNDAEAVKLSRPNYRDPWRFPSEYLS